MDPLGVGNPRIRDAAKLRQKKFRRRTGCILIEGARLVADAVAAGAPVREVFAAAAFAGSVAGRALEQRVDAARKCSCARSDEHLASALAPSFDAGAAAFGASAITPVSDAAAVKLSDTRSPQGVFAVVEFRPASLGDLLAGPERCSPVRTGEHLSKALVLVAHAIGDPGNLGTMIRSAAALGGSGLITTGGSCDLLNPKCVRATMGAIFRLPVVAGGELPRTIRTMQENGLRVLAAVPRSGKPPWEVDLARPTALLVGSEAEGLPEDAVTLANTLVTIPMPGGTESLNAAACAAALLYEAARQRESGSTSKSKNKSKGGRRGKE